MLGLKTENHWHYAILPMLSPAQRDRPRISGSVNMFDRPVGNLYNRGQYDDLE